MNKNKKMIIILSATIIGLSLLIGGTLAFFGWEGEESSVSVNVSSGEGSCTLLSDNNVEIFPTTNKVKGRKIQLTANQKMADKAYITWTLVVNKIDNLQEESFKYELVNTTTNESYGSGDFKDITSTEGSNTITFSHSTEVLGYDRDYIFSLFLWIDGENFDNPLEMADQEFDFNMYCDITGTDEGIVEKENVLMSVSDVSSETSTFLRSDLTKEQISSITFVDTNVVPVSDNIKSFSVSKDENDNSVMLWYNDTPNSEGLYDIYIGSEGGKITIEDGSLLFAFLKNVKSLDLSNFNTSKVTDMIGMFALCESLVSLDLTSFDTNNVTNMFAMFQSCSSLTELDLSNFDTSNVTNMRYMFDGCSSLTSLDLNNFDTSNVNSMGDMFGGCSSLTSLNLSGFDTSLVKDMQYMFSSCSSLTSLDLSGFDTSNVTNMESMFFECSSLTSLDLSNFDTSNVTNMNWMFYRCSSLTSLDLRNANFSGVTNFTNMLSGVPSGTNGVNIIIDDSQQSWFNTNYPAYTNLTLV